MDDSPKNKNIFNILVVSAFLLGLFTLAFGLGLMFVNNEESSGVRIISAQDYSGHEIKTGEVEAENSVLIDLNAASVSQLEELPGIGPVTAKKIIDNRPYSSVEELLVKKAVARSVFDKIRGQITVGDR